MAAPGQKVIYIGDRLPRDTSNLYTIQSIKALQHAANDLNGNQFKLWMYLSKNQDNFVLELSPKGALEWGLKKDTYARAVNDLIEKGYLQCVDVEKNEWKFEEYPQKVGTVPNGKTWDF